MVVERGEPGRTDRGVDHAHPPGPAERVADDHGDLDAGELAQPGSELGRAAVRVHRQQHHGAGGGVAGVDAGRGQDEAVPGLDDARRARAGRPAGRSRRRCAPRAWLRRTSCPSALLTTLLVTTSTSPSRRSGTAAASRAARSAPSVDLGKPGDRAERDRGPHPRSSAARSSAAAAIRRVALSVGHQQRHGAHGDPGQLSDVAASALVDQPAVEQAGVAGRRPRSAVVGHPMASRQASAMPRTGAPPTIGETPTTGRGRRCQRGADARDREDRADRHDRVGRRQEDDVGRRRSPRARRAPARASAAPTAGSRWPAVDACMRTHHSWKCTARPALVVLDDHVRLDPVVAHRQQPDAGLPAGAERGGDLREREPGGQHLRAHQVGREVAVAEPEPRAGLDAVGRELLLDVKVSSARPQPCSAWMPPPRVYITVSRSGQTCSPNRTMSSAVLPTTVIS